MTDSLDSNASPQSSTPRPEFNLGFTEPTPAVAPAEPVESERPAVQAGGEAATPVVVCPSISERGPPAELTALHQWVAFRLEPNPDKPHKPSKVPYSGQHKLASSTDPATWLSYEEAKDLAESGFDGLGIVFAEGGSLTGIDLDPKRNAKTGAVLEPVYDPTTGAIAPWAWEIIQQFGSYTEISPSGAGVHILIQGKLPAGAWKKQGQIEVYDRGRYFTVTGRTLAGYEALREAQHELEILLASRQPAKAAKPKRAHSLKEARKLLAQFTTARWDSYGGDGSWLDIGMALHAAFDGDDDALALWDEFSQKSDKYQAGVCAKKWKTFSADRASGLDFGSLIAWAKEDRGSVADALAQAVAGFNARWGLLLRGGNAVLETPGRGEPQFHEYQRWKRFVANEQVEVSTGHGTKLIPLVDAWLSHPNRRSYHGVVFDPTRPPYAGVPAKRGNDSDLDFNLWPGLALQPSTDGSCSQFLDHLRTIVCRGNVETYTWVVMWLAHLVQCPERLAGTALALRGPQGVGKSVVGDVMGVILGDALYASLSKPEELTGRFNSHHQGRLLLQVEEGFWAGDKEAEGALKHMITSKVIMVEPKFVDRFPVENFMRLLVTSNKEWVVPAGFGERRFAVLDVSEAHKDDRAYHGALRQEVFKEGGAARFLYHLLHEVKVDESVIWRPPTTQALADQQLKSLSDEDAWLVDVLSTAELPGDWSAEGRALTGAVFDHYVKHGRLVGRSRRGIETMLGIYLRRRSPLGAYAVKVEEINGRTYYVFPPLAACREAFVKQTASEVDWLVEADSWRKSHWGLNDKGQSAY